MTSDNHATGPKDDWRAWPPESLEGMPPKRRRLAGWALAWLFLILPLLGIALQAAGLSEGLSRLLAFGAAAVFLVPMVRAVHRETRQLRAEGNAFPFRAATRKDLVAAGVITAVLWVAFVLLLVLTDERPIPVVPIAASAWLIYQVRRRRAEDPQP
jgi:hypothetical protein